MVTVYLKSDSRYRVNRQFVKDYMSEVWLKRELPSGALSIVFVGSRKARTLAQTYLKDNEAHPVLTFPLISKSTFFPDEFPQKLLGEIVICYPQVTLYASEQNKSIEKVIKQFIDHAVTILAHELSTSSLHKKISSTLGASVVV